MMDIDQTTLAAYVDGELDPDLAQAVEKYLLVDPAAQIYVDQLRSLNGLTKMAYNAPMHDQPPQTLLKTILNADIRPEPTPVHPTQSRMMSNYWQRVVPFAAGFVGLLLGTVASTSYIDYRTHTALQKEAASLEVDKQGIHAALHQALEMNISGTSVKWNNPDSGRSAELTPVRTYQQKDKSYCREYKQEVRHNNHADVSFGIACRTPDGLWNTQYLIQDLRTDRKL